AVSQTCLSRLHELLGRGEISREAFALYTATAAAALSSTPDSSAHAHTPRRHDSSSSTGFASPTGASATRPHADRAAPALHGQPRQLRPGDHRGSRHGPRRTAVSEGLHPAGSDVAPDLSSRRQTHSAAAREWGAAAPDSF